VGSTPPAEATMTREQETEWLKSQVQDLQETISQIQDRLDKLSE
jgi:hypothetical protein